MSWYVEHPEQGRLTEDGDFASEGKSFLTMYSATLAMRRVQGVDRLGWNQPQQLPELTVIQEEDE